VGSSYIQEVHIFIGAKAVS